LFFFFLKVFFWVFYDFHLFFFGSPGYDLLMSAWCLSAPSLPPSHSLLPSLTSTPILASENLPPIHRILVIPSDRGSCRSGRPDQQKTKKSPYKGSMKEKKSPRGGGMMEEKYVKRKSIIWTGISNQYRINAYSTTGHHSPDRWNKRNSYHPYR